MDAKEFVIELLKIVASMVIPIVALLRVRTDLDRFAATQRAKESGKSVESQMRHRWYHRFKGTQKRS